MNIQDKALSVIDRLTTDDLCESIEMQLYDKIERGKALYLSQTDLEILFNKIITIYTVAHSADKSCICYEVHEDWRKETETLYKELKEK